MSITNERITVYGVVGKPTAPVWAVGVAVRSLYGVLRMGAAPFLIIGMTLTVAAAPDASQLNSKNYFSPERIEAELIDSLNRERKAQGLNELIIHPLLSQAALDHSHKMAEEKTLSHDFPNYKKLAVRLGDLQLPYLSCAENVAFSQSLLGDRIHQGFMSSEGHRRNILNPGFTHVGVRTVRSGDDFYVTQTFARLYEQVTPEAMEMFLEKELIQRAGVKDSRSLTFYPKLRSFARMVAKLKGEGKPLDSLLNAIPSSWGKMDVVSIVTADREALLTDLSRNIASKGYQGAGLGVSFLRNERFPGGAYSIALFLALPLPVQAEAGQDPRRLVLNVVNSRRTREGRSVLTLNDDAEILGAPAHTRAFRVFGLEREPNSSEREAVKNALLRMGFRNVHVISYKTADLMELPDFVTEQLNQLEKSGRTLSRIAILVLDAVSGDGPAAYFLVVLIV